MDQIYYRSLKLLLTISILLYFSELATAQSKNFNGQIVYQFTIMQSGVASKEMQVKYVFTDSTVTKHPLDDPGSFEVVLLYENRSLYHSKKFLDSVMVVTIEDDHNFRLTRDSITHATCSGHKCSRFSGKYSMDAAVSEVVTEFESCLSELVFVSPATFRSFDLIYNNSTGRIPLYVKKTSWVSMPGNQNSQPVITEIRVLSVN